MTATPTARMTLYAGVVPARGTYGAAAGIQILKGTIVTIDADGRADVVTAGQAALGMAVAHYDNRTTAPEGGAADAVQVEVDFGVFGWNYTGTAPEPGQVVYVVDNQTVSTDSDSGSRGIAGYCIELRANNTGTVHCYTLMGPAIAGQVVIAASEAAQLDTAQTDITNLQTDMAVERIVVPITEFRNADGTALAAFSDGVADGIVVSEGVMYRWNVSSTDAIWATVPLPDYLDGSENVTVRVQGSREGSADTDVDLTVGAYFVSDGDAYTADADCGGNTAAFDQATTVVTERTVTLANADVPSAPVQLSLSVVPDAALDSDDLNLHSVVIEIARTIT